MRSNPHPAATLQTTEPAGARGGGFPPSEKQRAWRSTFGRVYSQVGRQWKQQRETEATR